MLLLTSKLNACIAFILSPLFPSLLMMFSGSCTGLITLNLVAQIPFLAVFSRRVPPSLMNHLIPTMCSPTPNMVLGQSTPVLPMQLLESIHHWACSLNRSLSTHILFLDFTKAFDSVPHSRLLLKLEAIGIRGDLLIWLRNVLPNTL